MQFMHCYCLFQRGIEREETKNISLLKKNEVKGVYFFIFFYNKMLR